MLTNTLVLVACALILVWLITCVWRKRKRKLPPAPRGYLCFGNSFQIDTDRIHQDLFKYNQEFGHTVCLNIHGTSVVSLSSVFAINEAFELHPVSQFTNDRSKNSTADVYYGRKHIGCANLSNVTLLLRDFHRFKIFSIFEHGGRQGNLLKDEIKRLHLALINVPICDISPHEQLRILHRNLCSIVVSVCYLVYTYATSVPKLFLLSVTVTKQFLRPICCDDSHISGIKITRTIFFPTRFFVR